MKLSQLVTAALSTFCIMQLAHAETTTAFASVQVLDTLEISETKVVDFGAISGVDGTCSMGGQGNLSGSNGSPCSGTGQIGSFLINGTIGQSINISVNTGDGPSGISFQPELLSNEFATLADGTATALIGGQLALAGAPRGSQNLTYYITVNYN